MIDSLGHIAGIGAAMCWAIASVLYARVPIGAGAMTTAKNTMGAICLFAAISVLALMTGSAMFRAPSRAVWDICWSGVFGLWLGDIAYFRSIQILGARRGLTLTLLTPPVTALLSQIWLDERLSEKTWMYIAVTLVGIAIVMWQKAERNPDQEHRPGSLRWGVICSLTGIMFMAIGGIFLKRGMAEVHPIEGTFLRLLTASVAGIVFGIPQGEPSEIRELFKHRISSRDLCLASLLGTVVGVSLMLIAFKYCPAGIAATLTSTTPLFVIPVVYVAYREKVTWLAILGAFIAFAGVCGLVATSS